jgi:hypothetical protein
MPTIAATPPSPITRPARRDGSMIAKTASQRPLPRVEARVPARQAIATSSAAPSRIRAQASASGGAPPSIAILMKR